MPMIPGCLRPDGQSRSRVFDFEIVEKNGAGCKLVLPGRALAGTGPTPYNPACSLIIVATLLLNRVSRTDFFCPADLILTYMVIGVAPPQGAIAPAAPMR